MYADGEGVAEDDKAAVQWFTRAAEQGNAVAQNNLGAMYANGEGVAEDDETAVQWYRRAAEQGDAAAQYNLGKMYANGTGIVKDHVYAHMWASVAAAGGSEDPASQRAFFEQKMTPSQIAKAQKLARECVRKQYKGC